MMTKCNTWFLIVSSMRGHKKDIMGKKMKNFEYVMHIRQYYINDDFPECTLMVLWLCRKMTVFLGGSCRRGEASLLCLSDVLTK